MKQYLERNQLSYSAAGNAFTIQTNRIDAIVELIAQFKNQIVDFEVRKGTMNDVFLEITGKEIRK
jgi:ABC-2 type transport system ATP-binding protein